MPRHRLDLTHALGHDVADKRVEILRRTGELGSISEAARACGVSYKAAWQAVQTLSNLAGTALLDRAVGGAGGGGAQLTAAGEQLLQAAALMEAARSKVLSQLARPGAVAKAGKDQQDATAALSALGLASLGLRTSMRNHLPCRVEAIHPSGATVRVVLALGQGSVLTSRITSESCQLLGLRKGLPVLALCKATAVRIEPQLSTAGGTSEALNLLPGVVVRAAAGSRGGEVSLQLQADLHLVGFAPQGIRLRQGQPAMAGVD
jgi:molybdate transport system regulatory protein